MAHSEPTQTICNRAVLINSLIMSSTAAVFFIYFRDVFEKIGSLGFIGAVIVFTIAALSLYATTVTTLVGRRQNLFVKRLRSTAAGDGTTLRGLILPISMFSLIQVGVILGLLGVMSGRPVSMPLLAVAIVAMLAMMLALGMATFGVTNAAEQAQVTTLPISFGVDVVANWVAITGTESLTWLKRLLPGGAAAESIVNAWNGGVPLTDSLLLLAPTLGWVAVAVALASSLFRWEPRR